MNEYDAMRNPTSYEMVTLVSGRWSRNRILAMIDFPPLCASMSFMDQTYNEHFVCICRVMPISFGPWAREARWAPQEKKYACPC